MQTKRYKKYKDTKIQDTKIKRYKDIKITRYKQQRYKEKIFNDTNCLRRQFSHHTDTT